MRELQALLSRRRNFLVCKFHIRMGKSKSAKFISGHYKIHDSRALNVTGKQHFRLHERRIWGYASDLCLSKRKGTPSTKDVPSVISEKALLAPYHLYEYRWTAEGEDKPFQITSCSTRQKYSVHIPEIEIQVLKQIGHSAATDSAQVHDLLQLNRIFGIKWFRSFYFITIFIPSMWRISSS